jgi:2-dehydro-3-deoxyphosphogluconate aldolase/(4S)-4-hydroxy-2-oxoglutarate aldolase
MTLFFQTRILPVVTLTEVRHAVPLAAALLEGGIDAIEVTLRHPRALACMEQIAREVPGLCLGAGTVTRAEEIAAVRSAGAKFMLSPGCSAELMNAARAQTLPFIPGVMTPSEVMAARSEGITLMKLFPAIQAGGLGMLRALYGPFNDVSFCPTGGVTQSTAASYLQEPNVALVGGSWLTPADLVHRADWASIARIARESVEALSHPTQTT